MYLSNEQFNVALHDYSVTHQAETLLEQGSAELCEDVLLQAEDLYGVFDGATSLDKRRFKDGITGGLLAARLAAETFEQEGGSLLVRAEKANDRIRQSLKRNFVAMHERHKLWSTSMAVVRLRGKYLDYCQTGDAQILLQYDDGHLEVLTPDLDIDSVTLQLWKNAGAGSGTKIHDLLAEQIQKVRLGMNRTYGVLNGEPEALDFLNVGRVDLEGVSNVLLFTDGLFLPRANPLEQNDWKEFMILFNQNGLQGIRDTVREQQLSDPLLIQYPRFKLHDDIAAVAVTL